MWNPKEQQLIDQGYTLIREYNPWGKDSCFKHLVSGEIRYVAFVLLGADRGEYRVMNPEQMCAYLKDHWEPVSKSQVQWKLGMKQWFGLTI